jgi:hypothetical protein
VDRNSQKPEKGNSNNMCYLNNTLQKVRYCTHTEEEEEVVVDNNYMLNNHMEGVNQA